VNLIVALLVAVPPTAGIIAAVISTRALYRAAGRPDALSIWARASVPAVLAALVATGVAGLVFFTFFWTSRS
jgi:hypothetical protein